MENYNWNALMLGIMIGIIVTLALARFIRANYRQTLLLKATSSHPTPEKLPNGSMYYLIEEGEYNQLRSAVKVHPQPIGYITSEAVGKLRARKSGPGYVSVPAEHIWHNDTNRRRASVPVYLGAHS